MNKGQQVWGCESLVEEKIYMHLAGDETKISVMEIYKSFQKMYLE